MPKTLQGEKVPEKYWKEAKKQAKKQGFSIKDDKEAFYKYTMGILKQMMSNKIEETVVAGDVAVTNPVIGKGKKKKKFNTKPAKWSDLIKRYDNDKK